MVRVMFVCASAWLAWLWGVQSGSAHAQTGSESADAAAEADATISLSASYSHVDGQEIIVEARNLSASGVSASVVIQCGYGRRGAACDVLGQPDLDHDGEHTETVAVRQHLPAGLPDRVDCSERFADCALAVVVFGEGFAVVDLVAVDLDFGRPIIGLEDGGLVADAQSVRVTTVEELPDLVARQCAGDLVSHDCAPEGARLFRGSPQSGPLVVHARFPSPIDGRLVDCRAEPCTVRAFNLNTSDPFEMLPVAETPLGFGPVKLSEPALTVTPSRNLDSPQQVVVTPFGFAPLQPDETLEILLCGGPAPLAFDQDRLSHCKVRAVLGDPDEITTIRAVERFGPVLFGPLSDCSFQRCFVAAATKWRGMITSYALAELTFTTLGVSPDEGLLGGELVSLSARNLALVDGSVVVPLQCGDSGAGAVCAVVGAVATEGAADYDGDARVRRYLGEGSTRVDCGQNPCSVGLVVFDRSLVPVDSVAAPLSFAYLDIQLSQATGLQDRQTVTVTLPPLDGSRIVRQCVRTTAIGVGPCNPPDELFGGVLAPGSTSIDVVVATQFLASPPVDCRVDDCVIRVFRVTGPNRQALLGETPISFAPEP